MNLRTVKHRGRWWIVGHPDGPMGPYDTKTEADEDRRGVERFHKHGHKPGYVTTEKKEN